MKFSKIILLLFTVSSLQKISAQDEQLKKIITALSDSAVAKIDTTTPPNDRFTKAIKQLRKERGSFNVQQMGIYKIKDDQLKNKELPHEFYDRLLTEVTNGRASRLIENSTINLYRKYFTENDIKELAKFYKTDAGKKMATAFPIVMVLSAKSAEVIVKSTSEKIITQLKSEGKIK